MIEFKSSCNAFVSRLSLFICMAFISLAIYSQDRKFSSFELLYDIPQQVPESSYWPKYGLESMTFYNDTIFTLLIKEDFITTIPLTKKGAKIEFQKINLPQKCSPLVIARNNDNWYIVTQSRGILLLDKDDNYKIFIAKPQKCIFNNLMIVNDQILVYTASMGDKLFKLYDLNGNLLHTSKEGEYAFVNPIEYNDTIRDGYNDFTIKNNIIHISDDHDWEKYSGYSFVGGYQDMGYFVDRDERNQFVIRDLKDFSIKEQFFIPVKFNYSDLGIPEEDSFNLRVFSQDNNTFYFVTIKHKHLLIYKAIR